MSLFVSIRAGYRAFLGVILAVLVLLCTLIGPAEGASAAGAGSPGGAVVDPAAALGGPSYWLFGGDGGVFPFGRGAYEGGMAEHATNSAVVGGAVTPSGLGYWEVAADGGIFSFGDAPYFGGMAGKGHATIVGMAAVPNGHGYWLAASDGGVFTFGKAAFFGGVADRPHARIVAIAATPSGAGYWLAAADGAVYAFGDAPYLGGVSDKHPSGPIAAIATSGARGYWLAGADGSVYALGDAPYRGGASGVTHTPISGIASFPTGGGYWLVAADGGVFSFGSARYFGGVGSSRLNRKIVGIVSGDGINVPQAPSAPAFTSGFDISWPQCGGIRPAPPYGFGVVGVTNGHLFSTNPCFGEQWGWARTYGSFAALYVNTNAPDAVEYLGFTTMGPAGRCGANAGCILDMWGRRGIQQALHDAKGIVAPMWWLDVETGNQWTPDTAANAVILRAMIDELQKAGLQVGIYSTAYQWNKIAGAYAPGLPTWVPGAPPENPASYCADHSFAGGLTWMVQSGDSNFDTDRLCAAGLAAYTVAFARPAPLEVPSYADPVPAPPAVFSGPRPARPATSVPGRKVAGSRLIAAPPSPVPSTPHHTSWLLPILFVGGLAFEAGMLRRRVNRLWS